MGIRKHFIIAYVLIVAPSFVHATGIAGTVRINEIAWMGTKKSANAEWIELFNIGNSKISLSGWTLKGYTSTSLKDSLDIHFSNKDTIAPGGYFLLERTRNGAVYGVTADKIYTGSLKNSGETLILTNSSSTTVDTVVGGKNWCAIGGNNSTKQTAQRTATGWITALGTPRSTNATVGTVPSCATIQGRSSASSADATSTTATTATTTDAPPSAEGGASNTATTIAPVTTTSYSGHYGPPEFEPVPAVFISIGNNISTVAGADVRFGAVVTNKTGKQYTSAIVYWAFGDGSKATGTSVFKNYRAPGTYAVVANAVQGLGSGEDDMIVTVRNAHVSIPSISSRGITLRNDTPYRLDMSLWRLRAGTTTFAFPAHTVILPNTSVLFPKDITKLSVTNDTELLYPNGKEVAQYISGSEAVGIDGSAKKLSLVSTRYNTVRGSEAGNKNTHRAVRQNIINSHNATLAYDNEAPIAPATPIHTGVAGAPVAMAMNGRDVRIVRPPATSTLSRILNLEPSSVTARTDSFVDRFFSSSWTLPFILILILSAIFFVLL